MTAVDRQLWGYLSINHVMSAPIPATIPTRITKRVIPKTRERCDGLIESLNSMTSL